MIHIGPPDRTPPPDSPRALVSLAIGDNHRALWERCARPSWLAYVERHGLDLIVLTEPIDPDDAARRSPAWQKCLIPAAPWARRYQRLAWVDSDVVISPSAPDIFQSTPDGMIGATLVNDQCSTAERHILMSAFGKDGITPGPGDELAAVEAAWGRIQNQLYRANGVEVDETRMVATGVIVFEPGRHAEPFVQAFGYPQRSRNYEQPALSSGILRSGRLHRLSPRWNWGVWDVLFLHFRDTAHEPTPKPLLRALIAQQLSNAHFLHFYQCDWLLRALLDQDWGPEGPKAPK